MIFCGFLLKFYIIFAIQIRFIEADPADQNETDPNGSAALITNVLTRLGVSKHLFVPLPFTEV